MGIFVCWHRQIAGHWQFCGVAIFLLTWVKISFPREFLQIQFFLRNFQFSEFLVWMVCV